MSTQPNDDHGPPSDPPREAMEPVGTIASDEFYAALRSPEVQEALDRARRAHAKSND